MRIKVVFVLIGVVGLSWAADAVELKTRFGEDGLQSLAYGDKELLAEGMLQVTGAFFQRPDGTAYAADVEKGKFSVEAGGRTASLEFAWGEVEVTYATGTDRLDMEVKVTLSRDADHLVGLYISPLRLDMGKEPKIHNRSFLFYMRAPVAHNIGGPGVLAARTAGALVALCNEQMARPLAFGLGEPAEQGGEIRPVLAYTGRHPMLKKKFPFIDRPVRPGGRDYWQLSIRFGSPEAEVGERTKDLYERYARAYPRELEWEDRRPIGRLFISTSPRKDFPPPGNPRGWFNARNVDIRTEEGLKAFQERALKWADNAVNVLKSMHAQGMIIWDVEGQEYPHATSYLGDPRSLPPEFEPIADEWFSKFSDVGLRTGLTIRPQRPVRTAYGDKVFQLGFSGRRDRVKNLSAKISYAKKRWGCTIFYMDSNVHWAGDPVKIPGAEGYSAAVDARMLAEVTRQHPDVLILPEWEAIRTYAYGAPYTQLNYNKLTLPPQPVRRTYPDAFFVNQVSSQWTEEQKEALVASVRQGNILLFDGWYSSKHNEKVREAYQAAGRWPEEPQD
jgi:hypothetical protein